MTPRAVLRAAWAVLALTCATSDPGGAQEPDSLGGYLESMADSTDAYFGAAAAPTDTAGLDSTLAARLENPFFTARRRNLPFSPEPWLSFNRVDGTTWGAGLGLGRAASTGTLTGRLGYIAGPNEWRGEGSYGKRWAGRREGSTAWTLRASAGRLTEVIDPDHAMAWIRLARAFLYGNDRDHYLRRDGFGAAFERATVSTRQRIGFRSHLESPLLTTTTWSLFRDHVVLPFNQPAARGWVREIDLEAGTRIPGVPLQTEVSYRMALDGLKSDFDYRRLRLSAAGEWPLGEVVSLVPHAEYGRLEGDAVPQASFYLGGMFSLRSLPDKVRGGTTKTLARLDCVFAPDLLALARLPHPALLSLQGALFAGTGAVSGRDPYGGPGSPDRAWPAREEWRSEVGASLLYRPGLPDPEGFFRLDYAHPFRSEDRGRWSFYFWRPLGLLRALN